MHRVLLGSTETITSYPRLHANGTLTSHVASSATARRVGPGLTDNAGTYVSATIDGVNTATQGAQLEGSDSLSLAGSVSIVAGHRYLITDSQHGREIVVVATRGGTLSTLWVAEPLPADVANNSTVKGVAVSVALTASHTSTVGAGYVLFRAVIDGVTREWEEPFRVVRRITSIALTPTGLTQIYPVIRKLASATDTTLEEAINSSWEMAVAPALSARGVLDEDVMTDDVLMPMHAAATVLHLARQWPQASVEYVERLEANYEKIKQTTWDRIDFLTQPQVETPEAPDPGSGGPKFVAVSR